MDARVSTLAERDAGTAERAADFLEAHPRLHVLLLDVLGTAAACGVGTLGLAIFHLLL